MIALYFCLALPLAFFLVAGILEKIYCLIVWLLGGEMEW